MTAHTAEATEQDELVRPSDNGPAPEDGPQDDVSQDASVVVTSDVDDADLDLSMGTGPR